MVPASHRSLHRKQIEQYGVHSRTARCLVCWTPYPEAKGEWAPTYIEVIGLFYPCTRRQYDSGIATENTARAIGARSLRGNWQTWGLMSVRFGANNFFEKWVRPSQNRCNRWVPWIVGITLSNWSVCKARKVEKETCSHFDWNWGFIIVFLRTCVTRKTGCKINSALRLDILVTLTMYWVRSALFCTMV